MSYSNDQKRNIIMQHYLKPNFKKEISGHKITKHGASCADYLEYEFVLENNILKTINFNGNGCAFYLASTDLLIENLISKTKEEVLEFIKIFHSFLDGKDIKKEELEKLSDLKVFDNVKKHYNRLSCTKMLSESLEKELLKC